MQTIVLIGAGNIGSRHLQGLALLKLPVSIIVVDPFEASLATAKTRFEEVYKGSNISISYQTDLSSTIDKVDLAIIATNSKIRASVFEALIGNVKVSNVVFEKFLFQKPEEYEKVSALLKAHNIKAWVNCMRRMIDRYANLKEFLKTEDRFEFNISGSNWGLGCNGVHYLDLYSYLSNAASLNITEALLDPEVISSRREGYIEFTGTLAGRDEKDNTFTITSYKTENRPINITINTNRYQILILERGADSVISVVDKTGTLSFVQENFTIGFQSQVTNTMAEGILTKGECKLASYEESRVIHESILKAFIPFLQNYYNDKSINECPIT